MSQMNPPNEPASVHPRAREILSVAQLAHEAKRLLEASYPDIWVQGEISNLARPASGHIYFSLKDADAQIRCALFRGHARRCPCQPKEGMQVLVRGRLSLYEPRGDFQLLASYLEESGEGALRLAFEQLKQGLAKEGLFDHSRKRALPRIPRRVGVVTSASGAAIRDVLATLKRRFPAVPVLVIPVPVQGRDAAGAIADALAQADQADLADQTRRCDVLILARGGGSLEDLWAFNEEVVARAIASCSIPVVSGVGHETDISIADLVADHRAATPTAAAEAVAPDQTELLAQLGQAGRRLPGLVRDQLQRRSQTVDHLSARLVHPRHRLGHNRERLRGQRRSLLATIKAALQAREIQRTQLDALLGSYSPRARVHGSQTAVANMRQLLSRGLRHRLAMTGQQLQALGGRLDTVSPLATLERGYAVVRTLPAGAVVRRANQVRVGDRIRARVAVGSLHCRVEDVRDSD